jgi:hypothetical protein
MGQTILSGIFNKNSETDIQSKVQFIFIEYILSIFIVPATESNKSVIIEIFFIFLLSRNMNFILVHQNHRSHTSKMFLIGLSMKYSIFSISIIFMKLFIILIYVFEIFLLIQLFQSN